eukprot:c12830_g1_i1.p1 GENE.c12830_g1_i1~~c12830_g1_i1.p1  ORF type:complete len:157 (+),score=18.24 c12830_g1_i1:391-861(+)
MFSQANADVVCRQLGFPGAVYPYYYTEFTCPDRMWLGDVACYGYETKIEECQHSGWGENDCGGGCKSVGVYCQAPAPDPLCDCLGETTSSCPALHDKHQWCPDFDYCCGPASHCCKLSGGGIATIILTILGGFGMIAACVICYHRKVSISGLFYSN